MKINLDNALGVHPQALLLRSQRSALLSTNLANAETPGFKAKDMDFGQALAQAMGKTKTLEMSASDRKHLQSDLQQFDNNVFYREPLHASLDGNTVNSEMERVKFSENAIRYQASLTFIGRRFSGLRNALRSD